jgi:hypothetical protein
MRSGSIDVHREIWPCVLITLSLLSMRRGPPLLLQREAHSGWSLTGLARRMGRNVGARCRMARGLRTFVGKGIVTRVDYVEVVSIVVGRVSPSNTALSVGVIVMAQHIGGQ